MQVDAQKGERTPGLGSYASFERPIYPAKLVIFYTNPQRDLGHPPEILSNNNDYFTGHAISVAESKPASDD